MNHSQEQFKFVDAHVHFYDMKHPKLYYGHWQPDQDNPVARKLSQRNYLVEDFISDSKPHGMIKAVHVQAAIGSKDPVDETRWLQANFERFGLPQAIVGYVDLRAKDAKEQIERHLESHNFKGIRDFSYGDYLVSREFKRGVALVEEYNLVLSVAVQWQNMTKLAELAGEFPGVTMVLDHAGLPKERNPDYFMSWSDGMSSLAKKENIICKISGLGMGDNTWTVTSIRPYVEKCIELFGTKRSLFATNWPIDSLWSSYGEVVQAFREITQGFTDEEIVSLFAGNAERIYKI